MEDMAPFGTHQLSLSHHALSSPKEVCEEVFDASVRIRVRERL